MSQKDVHPESDLYQDAAWSAIVAEASAWIAMLHGPNRTAATEQGLNRWLEEDPRHRAAFELATQTWSESRAAIRRTAQVQLTFRGEAPAARSAPVGRYLGLAAAVLILVVGGFLFHLQSRELATGVGERRAYTLEDGTQVILNTATRIAVDYSKRERHIRLEGGEALFEVAKRPQWPFVVSVGDRQVTALGTTFLVRRDTARIVVTLVEGTVTVSDSSAPSMSLETSTAPSQLETVVLDPGQRLVLAGDARPVLDRPEMEKLTAWQRGKVHIDNLRLADAVAEMNRYSKTELAVAGADASSIRMSGVFKTGDSANFAQVVALTYGLHVEQHDGKIVLYGEPQKPSASRLDSDSRTSPTLR